MSPASAREWIDLVLDPGWSLLFEDVVSGDPLAFPGYPEQLEAARAKTGCSESVLVAEGRIDRRAVVAISFEFGFLGGSMGIAAGERICRAFEHAADKGVPVIALTASGGARMQEGMLALAQMPATLGARTKLADARQPFICYLRNPTTGGVYASFASSADLLWAEPRATIGFAGPRVAETVTGEPLPEDSHTAESAYESGLIDSLVDKESLRDRLRESVGLVGVAGGGRLVMPEEPARGTKGPWELVEIARHPRRPTGTNFVDVSDQMRRGGTDPSITAGIARLNQRPVVAIAQNRHLGGRTTPGGYRRARQAIGYASRFGLPIVTFIDTPGADPSSESEAAGVAGEISRTFEALLSAPVPTISVIVGEGGSGGALALAACDRLLILENAIFSVISPEGAAAILHRNDVSSMASDLKLTAHDLRGFGLADRVLPEPSGGTHLDPNAARVTVEAAVSASLDEIPTAPTAQRHDRWRVFR
jgi:acetyl-CoA carboxylase carboxyl transferase beta subunit/acetyl-CoA carboxylase carboxyl transferase alpha subunit